MVSRSIRWLCGLLGVVLGLLSPHAYGYQTNSSGGQVLRWDASKFPLPWYINMNGYTGLSAADAEAAFKHGMDQWGAPACTIFRTIYKGTSSNGNISDGTNVLMFGALSAGSSTTAITYTRWGSTSKQYSDADIVFRSTKPWSINPSSSQLDLRGTATHEIGHLLGLSHSSVLDATMYSKTGTGPSPRRFLDADDIKGLCFLYPTAGPQPPECTKDADCSANQVCQKEKCISKTEGRGILCGQSAGGASCLEGLLCVNKAGQPAYCVELCQNDTCPNGGICRNTTSGSQFCACDDDSECLTGQICQNRNCFGKEGIACRVNADCLFPLQCLEGTCQTPPAGCQSDADCATGQVCDVSKCVDGTLRGFGETCQQDFDCTSKVCAAIGNDTQLYCTKTCKTGSSDCPAGYTCRADAQRGDICHADSTPACTNDGDCPQGQRCQEKQCVASSEPTPEPSPQEAPVTPDASTPEPTIEPSIEPTTDTKAEPATPEATPEPQAESVSEATKPSSGCACSGMGQGADALGLGLLLCLLLLGVTRRRGHQKQS